MDAEKTGKYQPYPTVALPDRTWPGKTISKAPAWCSVDLRDGNQALIQPMNLQEKLEMFQMLLAIGFKEIEVGFPAASKVEYDFLRLLIEKGYIPAGVMPQVLTQAREKLIHRTFESIAGAEAAVVHLYNSTSVLQRRVVFKKDKKAIIELAVQGAKMILAEAKNSDVRVHYEYSPESFTGTELDYALEICEAVLDVWQPTPENPVIINLPATVEMSTPNVYADRIEWFCRNLKARDRVIMSLHAHNDRGCAVAATELALLAGGDRVEGTLFGNGERTGNVDILTLALNMFSQGLDPQLDFSDINHVTEFYERCTRLKVPPRHPYAGELVYTAFSGSHQDAINKGMAAHNRAGGKLWEVPYLPIDPQDLGRSYESIIRINSQSGKGGVAYIMEQEFGFKLPKEMHPEFGRIVQGVTDQSGEELSPAMLYRTFDETYLEARHGWCTLKSLEVLKRHFDPRGKDSFAEVAATITLGDKEYAIHAEGNGPLDAFCNALRTQLQIDFTLHAYSQHDLGRGSSSRAVCYIEILDDEDSSFWGVAVDSDIVVASIKAVLSALNRSQAAQVRERA